MSAQRIWEQALQQWLEEVPVLIDAASGEEYLPVRFFSNVDRLRKLLLQTGKKQFCFASKTRFCSACSILRQYAPMWNWCPWTRKKRGRKGANLPAAP